MLFEIKKILKKVETLMKAFMKGEIFLKKCCQEGLNQWYNSFKKMSQKEYRSPAHFAGREI
jgi:hypothetical protein